MEGHALLWLVTMNLGKVAFYFRTHARLDLSWKAVCVSHVQNEAACSSRTLVASLSFLTHEYEAPPQ